MLRLFIILIIHFILGAESGASFSWSKKWQSKTVFGHKLNQLPELIDAMILGFMAVSAWGYFIDMTTIKSIAIGAYGVGMSVGAMLYILFTAISYAGINSATWMFLRWETHDDPNRDRGSTTKPVVDWVAKKFGWALGDEGYSWTAATIKGSIIVLPFAGVFAIIGGLLFAFGYEIGSHFKKEKYSKFLPAWLPPHAIAEGMSFLLVGLFASGVLALCKIAGS